MSDQEKQQKDNQHKEENEEKNRGSKYLFQVDKKKIKLKLSRFKDRISVSHLKKRGIYFLVLVIFLLTGLFVYNNYLQRQQDFELETETEKGETFPREIVDNFPELSPDIEEEFFIGGQEEFYQDRETAETEFSEEEQPRLNESEPPEDREDVVTESVRPVMETEQEEIQLLRPVEGKIEQDTGWYFHPVFNDWRYLTGVNIRGESGDIVMAADSGVVQSIKEDPYQGTVVELNHEDVWLTRYGHLAETSVSVGESVAQGQEIGQIGQTGMVSEPILFFELVGEEGTVSPDEYFK